MPADAQRFVHERGDERRLIDATLICIARWGMAKTTLEDVGREARCSRATVYRSFPGGKDALAAAVVATEVDRFLTGLARRLDATPDLEDLLVEAVAYSVRHVSAHPALQYLLVHEPEAILPNVSFDRLDRVFAAVSRFAAPYLAPHVGEDEAPRAGEWLARIVVSYTMCPAKDLDLHDEHAVRRLVRAYVLPGLVQTVHS